MDTEPLKLIDIDQALAAIGSREFKDDEIVIAGNRVEVTLRKIAPEEFMAIYGTPFAKLPDFEDGVVREGAPVDENLTEGEQAEALQNFKLARGVVLKGIVRRDTKKPVFDERTVRLLDVDEVGPAMEKVMEFSGLNRDAAKAVSTFRTEAVGGGDAGGDVQ